MEKKKFEERLKFLEDRVDSMERVHALRWIGEGEEDIFMGYARVGIIPISAEPRIYLWLGQSGDRRDIMLRIFKEGQVIQESISRAFEPRT